ncbi:amidohydrolase family protein [Cohnella nanjingensis]|uniref:Amidohydrolase family protein n=1 Tax=Cohnella nanjingensis TaxID=1387779 RepID=A0A7X0RXI4_9BACL|nr:amidohydrolase family protein [Cohnella nanjingensis]MBB6675467.1 amidohydrolase family protein [Cohnella nanjingensis]
MDTLIREAFDPYAGERVDVGVRDGVIAFVRPSAGGSGDASREAGETVDARGWLLIPGLTETHIHLDKAFLASRLPRAASDVKDAIAMTAALKSGYTVADIAERSGRALDRAARFGVTRMRAHVEIDPVLGLTGWEAALALREARAGEIDLQLVAFPQEGIHQAPGTAALLEEAARRGADAVGGVPYNDKDAMAHLEYVFRLAASAGLPVDLHLDFSDDPEQLAILDVIALTERYGMQGRVAVGHLTSLGSVPPDRARLIAAGIAAAGISVFALPATDLYLNGRGDAYRHRRGLTAVGILLEEGANVCVGTNNLRNAFTPFGTGDPLDMALLLAQTAYLGSEADAMRLLGMCTGRAAEALGVSDPGIRPGAPANMLLVRADGVQDLIYDRPRERVLWRKGKRVAETSLCSQIFRPLNG